MAYDYTSASYGMGYIVTREILEDNLAADMIEGEPDESPAAS